MSIVAKANKYLPLHISEEQNQDPIHGLSHSGITEGNYFQVFFPYLVIQGGFRPL